MLIWIRKMAFSNKNSIFRFTKESAVSPEPCLKVVNSHLASCCLTKGSFKACPVLIEQVLLPLSTQTRTTWKPIRCHTFSVADFIFQWASQLVKFISSFKRLELLALGWYRQTYEFRHLGSGEHEIYIHF